MVILIGGGRTFV